MNIRGLSEATLDQLIRLGALKGYQDLYHLDRFLPHAFFVIEYRQICRYTAWMTDKKKRGSPPAKPVFLSP